MPELENEGQIVLALQDLATRIETLIDKQEELAENINKIKEAVYNPDEGLYARLNRLDARILGLESWKNNNTKILWIVITVGLGLVVTTAWKAIL
jgi:hypothetical protein